MTLPKPALDVEEAQDLRAISMYLRFGQQIA